MTNGDTMADLLEGKGHATTNDHLIDLVKEVVDDLNLVADLKRERERERWMDGWIKEDQTRSRED